MWRTENPQISTQSHWRDWRWAMHCCVVLRVLFQSMYGAGPAVHDPISFTIWRMTSLKFASLCRVPITWRCCSKWNYWKDVIPPSRCSDKGPNKLNTTNIFRRGSSPHHCFDLTFTLQLVKCLKICQQIYGLAYVVRSPYSYLLVTYIVRLYVHVCMLICAQYWKHIWHLTYTVHICKWYR